MKSLNTPEIPNYWIRYRTIDMHTAGEPLRVLVDGLPEIEANNVLEYRIILRDNYDYIRKSLIYEPRGHNDMYGVIIVPSTVADFGVVFIHNEGYSTMCGHATIALGRLATEAGWVKKGTDSTSFTMEAPCGIIEVTVDGETDPLISFRGVPSFVVDLDQQIEVPDLGKINYDLAYGGAFYAFVKAADLGISCEPENTNKLVDAAAKIKKAINSEREVIHPFEIDLSFLYGVIFLEPSDNPKVHSRNVCVFAEGEVDRSPTGSGVSARMAIHTKRAELAIGSWVTIESILGTTFQCRALRQETYGPYDAVTPEVSGKAYFTGKHEFFVDPEDPLKAGFLLR